RPVVECEYDLLVGERQALRILHYADMADFGGVDDKDATRSQRVGMAGAILRQSRCGHEGRRPQTDGCAHNGADKQIKQISRETWHVLFLTTRRFCRLGVAQFKAMLTIAEACFGLLKTGLLSAPRFFLDVNQRRISLAIGILVKGVGVWWSMQPGKGGRHVGSVGPGRYRVRKAPKRQPSRE